MTSSKSGRCIIFLTLVFVCSLDAQWTRVANGLAETYVQKLATIGANLYAGTNGGGIFLTTDDGRNWTAVNIGLSGTSIYIRSFIASGTTLIAGTNDNGLFISTNSGAGWSKKNNGLPRHLGDTTRYQEISALTLSGSNIFAGTNGANGFLSNDNGASWSGLNIANSNYESIYDFAVTSNYVFAVTYDSVYRSSNNGASWSTFSKGLPNKNLNYIAVNGSNLFVGSPVGVYRTTTTDGNWALANTGLSNINIFMLSTVGTNLFAGTNNCGLFISTNNGTSWTSVNTGLSGTNLFAIALCGSNLFVGTSDGVWRRPIDEVVTEVKEGVNINTPETYALHQNYPNPFNPSTTIRYELPSRSEVNIVIANALGQQVAILEKGEKNAGAYNVEWQTNSSSGIYFYRMVAISQDAPATRFIQVKKMFLLK